MNQPTALGHLKHLRRLVARDWKVWLSSVTNRPMVAVADWLLGHQHLHTKYRLYSVDFHASVSADVKTELSQFDVFTTRRVISFHNKNFRRLFRLADSLPGLNEQNWKRFTDRDAQKFRNRKALTLKNNDAFLVSYPTSFIFLYQKINKPILVVNPIRYEHPFSNRPFDWDRLDDALKVGLKSGQITFVANNHGDAAYAEHYLGSHIDVVPSLCNYLTQRWNPRTENRLTYAKYTNIGQEIEAISRSRYRDLRGHLGRRFSWTRLLQHSELFYVPYASSTMFLFEAATTGLPVAIPTLGFLNSLRELHPGVLGQLTFHQMSGKLPPTARRWVANDFRDWDTYAHWWFSRADFVDSDLMPNVRFVESVDALLSGPTAAEKIGIENYRKAIKQRNEKYRLQVRSQYARIIETWS